MLKYQHLNLCGNIQQINLLQFKQSIKHIFVLIRKVRLPMPTPRTPWKRLFSFKVIFP